jgi:hypothetical protein
MFPLLVGVEAFLWDIMSKKLMNYQSDRCCIYQARNGPCKIRKTREALLLRIEPSFPEEGVLPVLKFIASSSLVFSLQAHNVGKCISLVLPVLVTLKELYMRWRVMEKSPLGPS